MLLGVGLRITRVPTSIRGPTFSGREMGQKLPMLRFRLVLACSRCSERPERAPAGLGRFVGSTPVATHTCENFANEMSKSHVARGRNPDIILGGASH